MKVIIFYSWQSDSPKKVNKNFIEAAIRLAIKRLKTSNDFSIEAVLDRDTLGLSGSPAIAQSIFEKIDKCSLFLCDVTLITPPIAKRSSPNPNVLLELGYAAAKIGWERIICVMNQPYGDPSKLPFDLQHRRWPILYTLKPQLSTEERSEELRRLSENIEHAIRTTLESGILTSAINPKDQRVALKFEGALAHFKAMLGAFLGENGLEEGSRVFWEKYIDKVGTQYPDPAIVEPVINVCAKSNFKAASTIQIGEQRLNWAGAFINELRSIVQACDRILDQYSDRDDKLISLIDEIHDRARDLAFMIEVSFSQPSLSGLYDNGVPNAHIDWFRYFFLALIKSHRIICDFTDR